MGKRYKAKDQARLVETVRASGESVKVVARRMGVKESTAYYWMKRAGKAETPKFARVIQTVLPSRASVTIDIGGVSIHLEAGFDAALLREVVAALQGAGS